MRTTSREILLCVAFLALSFPALGKAKTGANPADYLIKGVEFKRPPAINGCLDNPIWQQGATLENFVQFQPQQGLPALEKTVSSLGYKSSAGIQSI